MTNNPEQTRTAVIGVGNILYGDDGFGVRVIRELEKRKARLPARDPFADVDLIDGGSMGVGLLEFLTRRRQVIIIDAADMGLPAGTLRVFKPEEVRSLERGANLSLHSTDVLGVIELGKTLGEALAEIHIIAVQPEFVGLREGLSNCLSAAVGEALRETRRLIDNLRRA